MAFYTIHPKEMCAIISQKRAIVIDVRECEEYQEYHYRNAWNCPYEEIERWMCRLPKGRPLILYCDYGSTSLLAARKLSRAGWEVYTVTGGVHAMRSFFED